MRKYVVVILTLLSGAPAQAARLKDLVAIEGVRENQLIGYGLVVGLAGTGDRRQTLFSAPSLTNILERVGGAVSPTPIPVTNTTPLLITATLSPFPRPRLKMDVLVFPLCDASKLQGGTLIV